MAKNCYLSASQVSKLLNVSLSTSYKVIKKGNELLSKENYQVILGRIPAPMLEKMYFGLNLSEREDIVNACV